MNKKYAVCIKYANLVIDEQDSDKALKAKCHYRCAWAYQAQGNRQAAYDNCVAALALPLKDKMKASCRQLKQKLDKQKAEASKASNAVIAKHGAKQQSVTDELPASPTSDPARAELIPQGKVRVGGFDAKIFKQRAAFWRTEFAKKAQEPLIQSASSNKQILRRN